MALQSIVRGVQFGMSWNCAVYTATVLYLTIYSLHSCTVFLINVLCWMKQPLILSFISYNMGWLKHTFLSILSTESSLGVSLILSSQICIDILNKMWNVFLVLFHMCYVSSPSYPSFNLSVRQGVQTLMSHTIIFLFSNALKCSSLLDWYMFPYSFQSYIIR